MVSPLGLVVHVLKAELFCDIVVAARMLGQALEEFFQQDLAAIVGVQGAHELSRADFAVAVGVDDLTGARVVQQCDELVSVEAKLKLGRVQVHVGCGRVKAQQVVRLVGGREQVQHRFVQLSIAKPVELGQVLGWVRIAVFFFITERGQVGQAVVLADHSTAGLHLCHVRYLHVWPIFVRTRGRCKEMPGDSAVPRRLFFAYMGGCAIKSIVLRNWFPSLRRFA